MVHKAEHIGRMSGGERQQTMLFALGLALVFGLATGRVLNQYLYDDCGWFVYSIGRMLDGGRLYVDIMEVNPPLFFWLMTPPIAAARWTGGDPQLFYKLWTMLLVAVSTALSHVVARRLFAGQGPAMVATLAVALVLALYPSWDFGQREHMSLLLAMPYIFLQALRRARQPVPVWLAVVAGVMAGLGFSLKPYMLAVPLVLELHVQWKRWSLGLLLRAENLAMGIVGAGYLAVVWLFVPAYFENLLPLALATYHAGHRISWWSFLDGYFFMNPRLHIFFFVIAAGIVHLIRNGIFDSRVGRFLVTLLLAAVGYDISWIVQRTGWLYLSYPPMSLATIAVIVALAHAAWPFRRSVSLSGLARVVPYVMLVVVLLSFAMAVVFTFPYQLRMNAYRQSGVFTPDVRSFYIFTMRMSEAFPFVNEMNLRWASRYPYLWPLPAIIKAHEAGRITPELKKAEKRLLHSVVEDLRSYKPDLIAVDIGKKQNFIRKPFDYLAYFSKAPGFEDVMRNYRLVKRMDKYLFFRRIRGGSERHGKAISTHASTSMPSTWLRSSQE